MKSGISSSVRPSSLKGRNKAHSVKEDREQSLSALKSIIDP